MEKDANTERELLRKKFLDAKPKGRHTIEIYRNVFTQEEVIKTTSYKARDKSILYGLRQYWAHWSFLSLFQGVIPIFEWLPKYSLKNDLIGDVIAGLTVAVMNIPHGMAYGLLAGVAPINGMYMAIFPVLVYLIFGTSKHISIGTFAVVSIMTSQVVQTYATEVSETGEEVYTPIQVATATAIMCGVIHFFMAILRLGTLSSLLSEPLVNGFTTGAAIHVMVSQSKEVIGVSYPPHKGSFKIIYTLMNFVTSIPNGNLASFIICVTVMIFMFIINEFLKPQTAKYCRFPIPGELMAVVGGTLISDYFDLHGLFGVRILDDIPLGLPSPTLPPFSLLHLVAVDAIAISIVSYSIVMSMGLTFAKKHSYELSPNQELFAMSVGNVVGGMFLCIPMACSLSRSVIQDQTGGKTQIASLVSALVIIGTVLSLGKFWSPLPRAVLAGVIIVALKPMIMQARELKKFAQQGKLELFTWILTFGCVVIIDIDIGLLAGMCASTLSLFIKGFKPYYCLLGTTPEMTGIYVDLRNHSNAVELPETKIFHYVGSLNFATKNFYKKSMYDQINVAAYQLSRNSEPTNGHILYTFHILILDFSALQHLDIAGCQTLSDIKKEMAVLGVRIFIASPADRVYDTIVHSMALGEGPFEVFPTLHDAVVYANACRKL